MNLILVRCMCLRMRASVSSGEFVHGTLGVRYDNSALVLQRSTAVMYQYWVQLMDFKTTNPPYTRLSADPYYSRVVNKLMFLPKNLTLNHAWYYPIKLNLDPWQ